MRSGAARTLTVLAIALAGGARAQDQARDWPRFHLGIAAGTSQLGADMSDAGVPEHVWGNHSVNSGTGWKVVAGFRPVRVVGVELQFVDFGEGEVAAHGGQLLGGGQVSYWEQSSNMKATSKGTLLAALLFIPEASRRLDMYAKVGVAELDESLTADASDLLMPECQPAAWLVPPTFKAPASCHYSSDVDQSHSGAYLGFGARFAIAGAAAVRLEYEAVDRNGGDPTQLLSVGIAAEF